MIESSEMWRGRHSLDNDLPVESGNEHRCLEVGCLVVQPHHCQFIISFDSLSLPLVALVCHG